MKKACIFSVLFLVLLMAGGCSAKQKATATTEPVNTRNLTGPSASAIQPDEARAEGKSKYGVLKLVTKDREQIEQLGAPSVYGEASDYSITGDYKVIFEAPDGKQTVISEWDNLQIIQPDNTRINLNKMSTDDADIFYFIPQYRGANDVPIHFFGITKDGDAFKFQIEDNKAQQMGDAHALSDSTAILTTNSPEYEEPAVKDKRLSFRAVYNLGDGQNYKTYNVTFLVDIKNRVLKYGSRLPE